MLACTSIYLLVLYVLTFVFYLLNCDAKRDRVSDVRVGERSTEWSGRWVRFGVREVRASSGLHFGLHFATEMGLDPYNDTAHIPLVLFFFYPKLEVSGVYSLHSISRDVNMLPT